MHNVTPSELASALTAALEASQNTKAEETKATQPVAEAEETKAEETTQTAIAETSETTLTALNLLRENR